MRQQAPIFALPTQQGIGQELAAEEDLNRKFNGMVPARNVKTSAAATAIRMAKREI
jgi:hypothetical protein